MGASKIDPSRLERQGRAKVGAGDSPRCDHPPADSALIPSFTLPQLPPMELVWRAGPVPLSQYLPSREEGPTDFSYLNGMPGHCRPREVGRTGERTSRIRLPPGPVGKRPCDTCAGGGKARALHLGSHLDARAGQVLRSPQPAGGRRALPRSGSWSCGGNPPKSKLDLWRGASAGRPVDPTGSGGG